MMMKLQLIIVTLNKMDLTQKMIYLKILKKKADQLAVSKKFVVQKIKKARRICNFEKSWYSRQLVS